MPIVRTRHRAAAGLLAVAAGLLIAMTGMPARAQGKLKAHYTITMTGITIGQIDWQVDIGSALYTAAASGKASGVLSVLVNGEGSVAARGTLAAGRLEPASYISTTTDDDGTINLQMTFAGGVASEQITPQPPEHKDRLPVSDADRRGVADPLSAVLISVKAGNGAPASTDCNHVLMIFDGRRRYNLVLTYDRVDKVALPHSYSGPVLVCGVILQPIAGYRSDSMLVKYVAGRRDMELWFAPIAGAAVMAPIRVLMPTLIGTLKIQADQFDAAAPPPAPASSAPTRQ